MTHDSTDIYWCSESCEEVPVEEVCAYWEGEDARVAAEAESSDAAQPDNGAEGAADTMNSLLLDF